MPERQQLYATASKGTEDLLADELRELGAKGVKRDRGGVRFLANLNESLHLLIWTRIAMRVLHPLATLEAKGAQGLYDAARSIAWEEHLTPRTTFAVDATLRESEHAHSGFVALKIKDAIADRLRDTLGARPDVDPRHPDVQVVAHLSKTQLSLSLDLAGEALHRRGYRVAGTEAPLKETLAAAILRAANYTGEEPLVDPMCGSGTIPIEAALIASKRAPNVHREFAVETWPSFGAQAKTTLADFRASARAGERAPPFPILGFDKNEEAVDAARRNARTAKVDRFVRIEPGDATSALALPPGPGVIVTNPPYGERLGTGGQKGMKTFYFKLGEALRAHPGYRQVVLCGNPGFESAFHVRPKGRRELFNGPIECVLFDYAAR
jgi:23S rRNA (guanine2445-N2)-methyltransferase / 23S rRNA (guanine2069-N7)-methyltransferase